VTAGRTIEELVDHLADLRLRAIDRGDELVEELVTDVVDLAATLEVRLGELAELVTGRLSVHELAIVETNRRIPAGGDDLEATELRLFGIPVVLAAGVTAEQIQTKVSELPKGLSGDDVVDTLSAENMLRRGRPA
jgi:hypothetical protein